jgi:hypothetical protein
MKPEISLQIFFNPEYKTPLKSVQWKPTDGQTGRHDENNSGFSQFCESA